jgi:hypothetical protein
VACDLCDSDKGIGGALYCGHYSICPKCVAGRESAGEIHLITERAGQGETFRNFVFRLRREGKGESKLNIVEDSDGAINIGFEPA